MQSLLFALFLAIYALPSQAKKLNDYDPYAYDVLFTNPICNDYKYEKTVISNGGKTLTAKPKNVYCKNSDAEVSGAQISSPLYKLLQWINDPSTKEIFFTYLSFSNRTVATALCEAIEKRDVKIVFVLDSGTSLNTANELLKCQSKTAKNKPELHIRGNVSGLGLAHNKIFVVNPNSKNEIKIAFGSGNLTSGIVLHHENWHFVTTHPSSYFAQSHKCAITGELDHAQSGKEFREFMKSCLAGIDTEPEEDIMTYFIPGDGAKVTAKIHESLDLATSAKIAAHRFSYNKLIDMLTHYLSQGTITLQLVLDDDMYWVGEKYVKNLPNTKQEYQIVNNLINLGAEAKFMETNHASRLLHHNKFILFENEEKKFSAVFTGAGNFTGTAFNKNLENFYYIEIPDVVKKMKNQFQHLYEDLATTHENLPNENILP